MTCEKTRRFNIKFKSKILFTIGDYKSRFILHTDETPSGMPAARQSRMRKAHALRRTRSVRGAFTRAVAAGARTFAPAVRTALGAGGRVRPCAGRHALGIVRALACPWNSGEHARAADPLTNRCS